MSPMLEQRWRLDMRVRADTGSLAEVREALGTLAIPPDVLENAKVLVSELVGNSVKHAGLSADDHVHVTAEWSGERLRVTVHDRIRPSTPPPVAAAIRPRPGADSGWGLFIVDRVSSRWGTGRSRLLVRVGRLSQDSALGPGVLLLGDPGRRALVLADHGVAVRVAHDVFDVGHDVRSDDRELASVRPERFVLGRSRWRSRARNLSGHTRRGSGSSRRASVGVPARSSR